MRGNPALLRLLQELLAEKGKIPFAQYMDLAVHHPEHGYYAKNRPIIGSRGDFVTAPSFHPAFGRTLWRQVKEMLDLMEAREPVRLLEIGAGGGHMAQDILLAAREDGWTEDRIRYLILERSARLRAEQRRRMQEAWPAAPLDWVPSLPGAEPVHVVLMNELMSAFPVHRLMVDGDGNWQELYVTWTGSGLDYTPGPVSTAEAVQVLTERGIVPAPGQIMDVNLGAPAFLAEIAQVLAPQAFVVTIDYGGPARVVYDPARPRGSTLRCYYRQQPLDSPFLLPGYQDITADLDFDLLIQRGNGLGLDTVGLLPQGPFLVNLGIEDTARELARRAREGDLAADMELQKVYTLYAPEGIGESFWVLVQCRGFDPPPALRGFTQAEPPALTWLELLNPSRPR